MITILLSYQAYLKVKNKKGCVYCSIWGTLGVASQLSHLSFIISMRNKEQRTVNGENKVEWIEQCTVKRKLIS